jgi:hypothetical protein
MSGLEPSAGDLRLDASPALAPTTGAGTRVLAGALVRCALRGEGARAGPHLLVRAPGAVERTVALPAELTVGRGAAAGLALDDAGASRLHARIRLDEAGAALVEDLGSKNGLRLNGRRIRGGPQPLRPGDELTVGSTALRFEDPLAGALAAAADAPGAASRASRSGTRWPAGRLAGPPPWAQLAGAAGLLGLAALLLALG